MPKPKAILYDFDGMLTHGPSIMTSIIENTAIRDTFEILFNYIWKKTESEHIEILKSVQE